MRNFISALLCIIPIGLILGQTRVPNPEVMVLDVNRIYMSMDKKMGEGGLSSQFSWNLAGNNPAKTEIFYWPRDKYQSNMLYQIYNPVCLSGEGIKDTLGNVKLLGIGANGVVVNAGATDWGMEVRRYRPPIVKVDGVTITPKYNWFVNPKLESDIKIEFEDVCKEFGIRTHVEIFAFTNADHGDYFIWKATHKFTGELGIPSQTAGKAKLPDQTINFYWPASWSFGPSKGGEYYANGSFAYEGEDDLDSWFKAKTKYTGARDSLYVAYYWDSYNYSGKPYPNGSIDNTGDPDRTTGALHSTQIPGYALLYADKSAAEKTDDIAQPYSLTHGSINDDFWGHNSDFKALYSGTGPHERFPFDVVTSGIKVAPDKGPMRFITTGPYSLTKNSALGRYDSLTFVYAIGAGDIGPEMADSIGKMWFNGTISDAEKKMWVLKGKDSLFNTLDKAGWAWNRMTKGLSIPSAPPPPDVSIISGVDSILVQWKYPDTAYFKDAVTGTDDWYAWRVYRKKGGLYFDDVFDKGSREKWEQVFETRDRKTTSFIDKNVVKNGEYFYAVTAVDDGKLNENEIGGGRKLESSRYMNASSIPAVVLVSVNEGRSEELIRNFSLAQNFPNPFNPSTVIRYSLPADSFVKLTIYDILGKEVAKVTDEFRVKGEHEAIFDASKFNLSSGVYFYRLRAGSFVKTEKMLLAK